MVDGSCIDNMCPHIVQRVWDFLTSHGVEVIHHAPYNPDLAPCDFFLFHTSKRPQGLSF